MEQVSGTCAWSGRRERDVDRPDHKRRVGSSAVDRPWIERTGPVDREDQSCRRERSVDGCGADWRHGDDRCDRAGRLGAGLRQSRPDGLCVLDRPSDKAYATTLIGGASHVASALLGPRDAVFGAAILGANYAADGGGESDTYSASSTFDFGYGGDLAAWPDRRSSERLRRRAGFPVDGIHHQANGVEILDTTFRSLAIAESFFRDNVIDLGSDFGPDIDLTFGYTLVADGSGGFGFDFALGGAVPSPRPGR